MRVVIVGGGIGGLIAALALRRHGIDVVIVESDDGSAPEAHERLTTWFRRGTPHARQAHAFAGGFIRALGAVAPHALEAIRASDVIERSIADTLPPTLAGDEPHEGDDELRAITARRPHVEWFVRRAVLDDGTIAWRYGHVRGLSVKASDGIPHVTGIETDDGPLPADVVIDASGRRSRVTSWLGDHGVEPSTPLSRPCDLVYRSRYYHLRDPAERPVLDGALFLMVPGVTHAALMFPGDNGTMQAAMTHLPNDDLFSRAGEPDVFHAIMMAEPSIAEWLHPDRAEPFTDVGAYGGLHNYLRRLVVDGEPLVTGLHLVGDAAAITNPQFGRGVSHAAVHAHAVARSIAGHPDDPRAQALAVDDEVTSMLESSVRDSIRMDRARSIRWRAIADGAEPPPPEEGELPGGITSSQIEHAFMIDPVVHRAFRRSGNILQPMDAPLRDPDVLARIRAVEPPEKPPAPGLDDLLRARGTLADVIAAV